MDRALEHAWNRLMRRPLLGSSVLAAAHSVLRAAACAAAPDRAHPFLFVTTADIERARDGVKRSPVFADLAKELTARATTNRLEDLPPLEREWWQTAKQKPWRDTYPEIFHHTWIVPLKWADLARNCARANLVSPSAAARRQRPNASCSGSPITPSSSSTTTWA